MKYTGELQSKSSNSMAFVGLYWMDQININLPYIKFTGFENLAWNQEKYKIRTVQE